MRGSELNREKSETRGWGGHAVKQQVPQFDHVQKPKEHLRNNIQRSVTFYIKLRASVAPRGLCERELVRVGRVNQKSLLFKLL